ncbi:unnamed protein product, partial [Porites evermanni]
MAWFKSYLSDRTHFMSIRGARSVTRSLLCGLYLSFNSLSGDDQAYSVSQVESCVRDIDHWMSCNKLKLNRDKTELLV